MLRVVSLVLVIFTLSACATGPRYLTPSGTTVAEGVQVLTYCRGEAVARFPQTVALGNPFFAAAAVATVNVRQTYVDDCMDARGFHLCGPQECRSPA